MIHIDIPTSKSYAQRMIICAVLSHDGKHEATIYNVSSSNDIMSCIDAMRLLGAEIEYKNQTIVIKKGIDIHNVNDTIHVGESGTTCRILIPILASLNKQYVVTGIGSLNQRDMSSCADVLDPNPVYYSFVKDHGHLPITVIGRLLSQNCYELDGSATSQYISGLIIAHAYHQSPARIRVRNCDSYGYIKITLDVLSKFGVNVNINEWNGKDFDISIIGNEKMDCPWEMTAEPDWSSFGAIYLAASLLGEDIMIHNMNIESAQPDSKIFDIAIKKFKNVSYDKGDIIIHHIDTTSPFSIDISETPDLFPYYAGLAAVSNDYCALSGMHKLVNKESDRKTAIYEEFNKLGIDCKFYDDTIYIKKGYGIKDIEYDSHNDHRIGQVLAVMKLLINGRIKDNDMCIDKSYPNYIKDIEKIYGKPIRKFI